METINGAKWGNSIAQVTDRSKIVIAGWAVDNKAKKSPVAVSLRLQHEGKAFHADAKILPRPELAAYFKESFYQNSGYEATVSAIDLPAGEYDALVVIGTGDKATMCASGRKLVLK